MVAALDLLPDGTFIVRDGTNEWRTRRPTIGEWRQIVEAVQRIDDEGDAIETIDDLRAKVEARQKFLMALRYLEPMALALTVLGAGEVSADDLPLWCGSAQPWLRIFPHWRAVPLDLSPPEMI